jgi:hypothetical protein
MMEILAIAILVAALAFGLGFVLGRGRVTAEQRQERVLNRQCPGWRQIVGWLPDGTYDPDSPFRKWLASQPIGYQIRINNSRNAAEILRAITAFRARSTFRDAG